jgi:hypothetical protein
MPSERPYSGMSWDDLARKINKVMIEFVQEVMLVDEELQYRHTPAAIALRQRVERIREFFVKVASEEHWIEGNS